MFKPGELAKVVGSGRRVVIKEMIHEPREEMLFGRKVTYRHPVLCTFNGKDEVIDESDLLPAHPTVLATADGRHLATEQRGQAVQQPWMAAHNG